MEEVDKVLEHFGRKGMKWGIHKFSRGPTEVSVKTVPGKKVQSKGGERQPSHDDAINAAASKQKAKASTTDSLSDNELKSLVTRMQMEQNYSKLTTEAPTKSTKSAGRAFVGAIVGSVLKTQMTKLGNDKLGEKLGAAFSKDAAEDTVRSTAKSASKFKINATPGFKPSTASSPVYKITSLK